MSKSVSLESIKINRFDPSVMEKRRVSGSPPTCIFIGKRGTGKSTLIADIMFFMRAIPFGMIISGTEEGTGFYKNYFPDLFIHSEYQTELVESLVNRQRRVLKEVQKADPQSTKPDPHSFLLLDDLMYDKSITNEKIIRQLFFNGRHLKILFLLSLQYCMSIRPELRSNVDYLFILRENNIDNQKKMWKSYFGMFEKFTDFQQTFMSCTENYECIVLDNTSKSNKIEDCVFWYKATPNRKYKLGSLSLWKFAASQQTQDNNQEPETSAKKKKIIIRK